jgi:hypothetical protein
MQSVATINQRMINESEQRARELNDAAKRLLQRQLGCWQHDLSRPFTDRGRTYRVCVKCGLSRDFNLATWKTQGASYALPPNSLRQNSAGGLISGRKLSLVK